MSLPSHGLVEIRPRIIFELVEEAFPDQVSKFTVNIPPSHIGGLLLLESAILVSLVRILDARQIFEFGTYMGATSVLLAENSSPEARVTTLDLDPADAELSANDAPNLRDATENDEFLRSVYVNEGPIFINRASEATRAKIRRILTNSMKLDIDAEGLRGRHDLVFIDGGHDLETIANDTRKALEMTGPDAVVAWHDFRSTIHTDVTTFMDGFTKDHLVVHVQNTMLALLFKGTAADLIAPKIATHPVAT